MIGKTIVQKQEMVSTNTKDRFNYDEEKFYIYKHNFNPVNVDEVEDWRQDSRKLQKVYPVLIVK